MLGAKEADEHDRSGHLDTQVADERIELDVITGFLGAGKTTLINKLLAEGFGGAGTALLENEFGDVAIDSDLVEGNGVEVRTMATGCICCTLRGDFVDNLVDIVDQYHPTRIIVEPTGLANLADILDLCDQASKRVPLRLNAVITVVSAENLMPVIFVGGDFFTDQLDQARFFLVSCSQLVDDEDLEETLDCLAEHAGEGVPILCRDWADISTLEIMTQAEQALHDSLEREKAVGMQAAVAGGGQEVGSHDHGHGYDHDHGHHHHVDEATGCSSAAFEPDRSFTAADLDALASLVDSGAVGTILRAKGFLNGPDGAVLFEYVYKKARWSATDYSGPAKFVVIGRDLDEGALLSFFGGKLL